MPPSQRLTLINSQRPAWISAVVSSSFTGARVFASICGLNTSKHSTTKSHCTQTRSLAITRASAHSLSLSGYVALWTLSKCWGWTGGRERKKYKFLVGILSSLEAQNESTNERLGSCLVRNTVLCRCENFFKRTHVCMCTSTGRTHSPTYTQAPPQSHKHTRYEHTCKLSAQQADRVFCSLLLAIAALSALMSHKHTKHLFIHTYSTHNRQRHTHTHTVTIASSGSSSSSHINIRSRVLRVAGNTMVVCVQCDRVKHTYKHMPTTTSFASIIIRAYSHVPISKRTLLSTQLNTDVVVEQWQRLCSRRADAQQIFG